LAYLLHIETSSTNCSVAISNDDKLIAKKESNNGYTHAENLHLFIEDIIKQCDLQIHDLNAISISSGPGSYTGLRIGYSAAKGLSYALKIPIITVETLKALSFKVINIVKKDALYCPLIDARRMEVYTVSYDYHLNETLPLRPLVLNESSIELFNQNREIYFFGDGMQKAKKLLLTLKNVQFIEHIDADAESMISLAFKKYIANDFVDAAYAEPNYLKEFFFTTAKK
jgi:tRNA threonylcarbamoyladenosine biosynthesis protein TsaB